MGIAAFDARNVLFGEQFQIFSQQAITKNERVAVGGRAGRLLGRFHTPYDDVCGAEIQDLILSLLRGAFANRQHGNHREHTEHNAEHR